MAVSGLSVAYLTFGGILLWSGIKGETLSQAIQDIAHGKAPSSNQEPITSSTSGSGSGSSSDSSVSSEAISALNLSNQAGTPTANMAAGQLMAASYGWTGDNWLCLKTGWQEESGWNQFAFNVPGDYNAAYGIPQANPGTKMASAGSDWKTDPITQIKWGLGYIKSTYGSPSQVSGWTVNGPAAGYVGY